MKPSALKLFVRQQKLRKTTGRGARMTQFVCLERSYPFNFRLSDGARAHPVITLTRLSTNRQLGDSPWEFLRPVTGMGSNSSSVPTSALACWGSKSEIRRVESAADMGKKRVKKKNNNTTNAADIKNCTVSVSDDGFSLLRNATAVQCLF